MIAYLILVHRYPNQFKRLFRAVYGTKNYYLIHVDKKAGTALYEEISNFLVDFPNAHILKSQNVVWGGYSMVDVELRGMQKLLMISKKWDFFINLSGQDFPLKSQTIIQNFLKENARKDFIQIVDQAKMRPITLNRINNYFCESENGFSGTPYKRTFLPKVTPYIGGQWTILSRNCCEFICSSPKVAKFRKFYKNTLIPDESFFQTVLMNTGYTGRIINDDKRAIIWMPDINSKLLTKSFATDSTNSLVASGKIKLRPKTLTIEDLPFLLANNAFFARKFDENVDLAILDLLESRLQVSKPKIKLGINQMPLFSHLRIPRPSMGVDEAGEKRSLLPNIGKPHPSTGGEASLDTFSLPA